MSTTADHHRASGTPKITVLVEIILINSVQQNDYFPRTIRMEKNLRYFCVYTQKTHKQLNVTNELKATRVKTFTNRCTTILV